MGVGSSEGRRLLNELTETEMQAYIGEYLNYLTDGAVEVELVDDVVTTRIVGQCSVMQPLLEEIANELLDGMATHFGTPFVYMGISCETTVVVASPPATAAPTAGPTTAPTALSPSPLSPPPQAPAAATGPVELVVQLNWGWTWMSLNVQADDMGIDTIFAAVTLSDGDHVKSQFKFTQYYSGYGFYGTLQTLATDSMYGVQLTNEATLSFTGTPVALPKSIAINGPGAWTYVPCPHQTSKTLALGLPYGVEFGLNDQFKSQFKFASYYPGYGWFGSLATVVPGNGYMLWVSGSGGTGTFQ